MSEYKLWEMLTPASLDKFKENFLDAVLDLHGYNEARTTDSDHHLTLTTHNFIEGPGFLIVKYVHSVMMKRSRPRRQSDGEAPPEFTRVLEEYYVEVLGGIQELKGYSHQQLLNMARSISYKLGQHRLAWKQSARGKKVFLRAWPADLTTLDASWPEGGYKDDWYEDKRVAEESVKAEETLKVYIDIDSIPPPKADDPQSFVRYVKALRACYDKLHGRYEKQAIELEELHLKVKQMEEAKSGKAWEAAAAEIDAMRT